MSKEQTSRHMFLKVYIHCDGCKQKVKRLLQNIEGNVDPNTLIKKTNMRSYGPQRVGILSSTKQFQALQINNGEDPKGGKPQKGGKDQKGQEQQQQQQLLQKIQGLKDTKLRQFKDLKLPTKAQKSVKFI